MAKNKEIQSATARQISLDYLCMLFIPVLVAWYFYRERALRLLLTGIACAVLCELLAMLLFRSLRKPMDYNSIVVGACIALLLPADAPYAIAALGSAFAVLAVKLPFGGTLHSPFVPAAAGFAFMTVCFPQAVFAYPQLQTGVIHGAAEWIPGVSLANLLQNGSAPRVNLQVALEFLAGSIAGPMGTTCILGLLVTLLFPMLRNPRVILGPLGFLISGAVMAFAFPRVQTTRMTSVFLELCAGMLLFCAVFFVTDPATSPKTGGRRLLYGLLTGFLCMLLRFFGLYEEGTCFAVLAANALWPVFEGALDKLMPLLYAKLPLLQRGVKEHG